MYNINDDIVCLLLPNLNSCFHEIMNFTLTVKILRSKDITKDVIY